MFQNLFASMKRINYRLFFALLVLGFCPTIYGTLRVFFIGRLPGDWAYSVAGQLSWVNLLYEIMNEAIILPLFFFVGQVVNDKKQLENRVRSGLLITFSVYAVFSAVIIIAVNPLLKMMATDESILTESAAYIRIESVADIFAVAAQFLLITLIALNKDRYIYVLTFARLALSILLDTFLVSSLPVSLNLGVNGIGVSNIIVNIVLLAVSILLLGREGIALFSKEKLSFAWTKNFFKIGGISGVESFVRNIAYMLMISRMVNIVNEQGVYWVANEFIWGWLLLPVTQLGELIKQEVSTDVRNIRSNSPGYFGVTAVICLIWYATVPAWKPFMNYILGYSDVNKLFSLVLILLGFYVVYAFQNVFDATFYGLGKTNYMLLESVVTNTIYYGIAFVLYRAGVWKPTLTGIALMFGFGMAFDGIVSFAVYLFMRDKMRRRRKLMSTLD